MALGQSSFRRILLSRLLLVSVPVLLVGVYVTYRKARTAFLETARQNLAESAIRQSQSISQAIADLRLSLIAIGDSKLLQSGSDEQKKKFITQLAANLPPTARCMQLWDFRTQKLAVSTCSPSFANRTSPSFWGTHPVKSLLTSQQVYVYWINPSQISQPDSHQLNLGLSIPIYNASEQLQYSLTLYSSLLESTPLPPGSLAGYPVVIDQEGTILAHPYSRRIGKNIRQESDVSRLKMLIYNAIAGKQDFLHLFSFDRNGLELVAGYSAITSPITNSKSKKWAILSVTPLEKALAPLDDIKKVLFGLMLALLTVTVFAVLIISWEIARPLEKLRDYALNKENIHSREEIPRNFNIKEFNQLALAVQMMVERLQAWGDEVLISWKEAQDANRLKSEFLATTSHELRTPINGILGSLRIIKEGYCDSPEEVAEFIQQADDAAVHLLTIINDILDLARIESGKLSLAPQPIELSALVKEVTDILKGAIQQKGLQLLLPQQEKKITVEADLPKLKQVLLNVIGNALKFTDHGKIAIAIEIQQREASAWGVIKVSDTGIGIDPTQQEKLFRPFVMADGSTTRKFAGTGLGLAISRNLMELMGGTIDLQSQGLGQGSTIEIALPLFSLVNPCEKLPQSDAYPV
jgi:signal transduction histidine kinase